MRILKKFANNFFQEVEKFRLCVKYKYKIIGKLTSIKVLWELFHPNTPIKNEL